MYSISGQLIVHLHQRASLLRQICTLGLSRNSNNPNDPKVQTEDSFVKMQERAKEKGFGFAYLFDEGQVVYPQYGATRTPEVYLLEKTADSNIIRYTGAIDNNYEDTDAATKHYVEDAVDNLLAGTPQLINPILTKAIGCTIKAK